MPKNAVYSQERDLDRAREIAERGLILRTTVGSVVHVLARVDAELVAASDAPRLRDTPDIDAVDRFVVRAYRAAWDA